MNVLMLLAQGAMNMADSLATANPVLTPVSYQGWLDYDCTGCTVCSLFLHLI